MRRLFVTFSMIISLQTLAQINLDSMLTLCLPFSGNTKDFSGEKHHALVNGPTLTLDRFGSSNRAYLFDGNDDYMDVANWDSICPTDEVSISFWSRADSFKSQFAFSLSPEDTSGRMAIQINYKHSGLTPATFWDYQNITTGRLQLLNDPYVDIWEHYVFVVSESSDTMRIYRNGTQIASKGYGGKLSNKARTFKIGALNSTTLSSTFNFDGAIDDIRVYNREITTGEVASLYANTPACPVELTGIVNNSRSVNALARVFPNPAIDESIYIQHYDKVSRRIEVYSLDGKLVIEEEKVEQFHKLNISSLNPGVFVMKLYFENRSEQLKLIVP